MDASQVIQALREHSEPVDLDASKERWASTLRCLHPDEFRKGSNRICTPLSVGGELIGMLILGDRVGGIVFSTQDLDLLKAVGDQAAASLMNRRLSQRLRRRVNWRRFRRCPLSLSTT